MSKQKIALIGNPNCGKTSIFNILSGLNQKVGNFGGVTVEKKSTNLVTTNSRIQLIDFPGTYSLYPNGLDERIVVETLTNSDSPDFPDAIIYVSDILKLEQQTLLLTQLMDLGFPIIWVLNRSDLEGREGQHIDAEKLEQQFGLPVLKINTRNKSGFDQLWHYLNNPDSWPLAKTESFYSLNKTEQSSVSAIQNKFPASNSYQTLLQLHHNEWLIGLDKGKKLTIETIVKKYEFQSLPAQVEETMARYNNFLPLLEKATKKQPSSKRGWTSQLDKYILHPYLGPVIFLGLMFFVFQAIYAWATYPMDWIEAGFSWLSNLTGQLLPDSWLTSLIADGVLAGIGGVVIFIPQIAILFFLIGLLEEGGYMARAATIWDRPMKWLGLNGRSIVALISGAACAVPAIMSARTISNQKERLITILVTPFISCSARIPVYTILIGFVVPYHSFGGFFNTQGLAFMGLYLAGILGAALVALIIKSLVKTEERSMLVMELPRYQIPSIRNVLVETSNKVWTFIAEAGKIILVISIILWFAASYGPSGAMQEAEKEAITLSQSKDFSDKDSKILIASKKLEASYAGHFGKIIEPIIEPLGFDWKIGIALLTSFAAREVFVGTMATIYNVGDVDDDQLSIKERMTQEVNPITGKPIYNFASALALLVFYIFALQCMSTLAIIKKETGGWEWPVIIFMIALGMAYFGALGVYQILG